MARRAQASRTRRRRKRSSLPGWLYLLIGLAFGLFVALLVDLHRQPARPYVVTTRPAPVPERKPPPPVPPKPKPRYDFYALLPKLEVVVPEQKIAGPTRRGVREVQRPGTYVLQAGAFRTAAQADRLKARLALLGLEAQVRRIQAKGRTWYRVHLGPYRRLADLNRDRARLKQAHIDAILLRLKGKDWHG